MPLTPELNGLAIGMIAKKKTFGLNGPKNRTVYALGIFKSYDERQSNQKNFLVKIDKLGAKRGVWQFPGIFQSATDTDKMPR